MLDSGVSELNFSYDPIDKTILKYDLYVYVFKDFETIEPLYSSISTVISQ